MTAHAEQPYVLGTGDDEFFRLGYQHRVWLGPAADAWDRAGFSLGQTLLDVGCGPGFATIDLAHLVGPTGRIIAIDESRRFVERLASVARAMGLTNIQTRIGDVQAMAFDPGSMDGAYVRWVLCFVPRPGDVVAAVAAALRPGGVFVVQDYCNYRGLRLSPPSRIMEKVMEAVDRSFRIRGGDPDIGLRVPSMMADAGLKVVEVRPLTRVAKPGTALWNWPLTFFRNYLPVLHSMNLLTESDCAEWHAEWESHSRNPAARFLTPPMVDIIAVRR